MIAGQAAVAPRLSSNASYGWEGGKLSRCRYGHTVQGIVNARSKPRKKLLSWISTWLRSPKLPQMARAAERRVCCNFSGSRGPRHVPGSVRRPRGPEIRWAPGIQIPVARTLRAKMPSHLFPCFCNGLVPHDGLEAARKTTMK